MYRKIILIGLWILLTSIVNAQKESNKNNLPTPEKYGLFTATPIPSTIQRRLNTVSANCRM